MPITFSCAALLASPAVQDSPRARAQGPYPQPTGKACVLRLRAIPNPPPPADPPSPPLPPLATGCACAHATRPLSQPWMDGSCCRGGVWGGAEGSSGVWAWGLGALGPSVLSLGGRGMRHAPWGHAAAGGPQAPAAATARAWLTLGSTPAPAPQGLSFTGRLDAATATGCGRHVPAAPGPGPA